MQQNDLMDLLVLEKKLYNCLSEIDDLTRQLAEATDRQDQVTLRLLISMRQEPINLLQDIQHRRKEKLASLSQEDADRVQRYMQGKPAEEQTEIPITNQIATNQRLLQRIVDLDRRISQKLGGDSSFYKQ